MSPCCLSRPRLLLAAALLALLPPYRAAAFQPAALAAAMPSAEEVQDLLRREPVTRGNWPTWRGRLLAWIGDRSHNTDAAYEAARTFTRREASADGQLTGPLAGDALAWYFLGNSYYQQMPEGADLSVEAEKAEKALRESLRLDPKFARAHRNLAVVLSVLDKGAAAVRDRSEEARRELDEARRLDPALPLKGIEGQIALRQKRFADAERLFAEALVEDPDEKRYYFAQALALMNNPQRPGKRAAAVKALLDRAPDDGDLVALYGFTLAEEGDPRGALREFECARKLGGDPGKFVPPQVLREIEEAGAPGVWERAGLVAVVFAGVYAAVLLFMACGGLLLAGMTRGTRALGLLGAAPDELVASGQVTRTSGESWLASLYALALAAGLLFFYAAIPFLIAALLAGTAGLLFLVFQLGRIPIKLVVIIVIAGLGGAWAVLRSLFARPASGAFGLAKTPAQCPRLYEALAEVARRVETSPVDEVYLAPGSAISVHQEGRGPFGLFGVKRRVLTLGLSTMHYLTLAELKSILAHEYAHFSHRDTFYSRFIYQVALSIGEAVRGMGETGGVLTYVNPVYWFLYLYYKCYGLLSSGFSRSREFLADRMAATLYGSEVFATALTKVCTDGTLFEMTMYDNIARLLQEDKAFANMYSAFRGFRDEQLTAADREELYQKVLHEKGSLFASHPTFAERMEAVAPLPRAEKPDDAPALSLFDDVEGLEKELTEFLTGYIYYTRQQAQAAPSA